MQAIASLKGKSFYVAVKAYGKKSCKFIFNARLAILKATALCYPITRCHKYTEYPLHDVMLPNNFRDENRGLIWSLKKEKLKKKKTIRSLSVLFSSSFLS